MNTHTLPVLYGEPGKALVGSAAVLATAMPCKTAADVEERIADIETAVQTFAEAVEALAADAHRTLDELLGERESLSFRFSEDAERALDKILGDPDPKRCADPQSLRFRLALLYDRMQAASRRSALGEAA